VLALLLALGVTATATGDAASPTSPPQGAPAGPPGQASPTAAPPRKGVLTRAPRLRRFVEAAYPPDALARRIAGAVELELVLGPDGRVREAKVVDPGPHPDFAAAALAAVRAFEFEPAEIDGKPAPVAIAYRYEFTLREEPAPPPPAAPPAPAPAPAPPPARERERYETVVRGDPEETQPVVRDVTAEEVRTLPGTQGDTLKVLQNFPGVARAPFGLGFLVVRGSAPQDTRVYVDGVEIPLLFHFGGITSTVASESISGLEFMPGNFGARYGRAMGGSVEIRTREARRSWHGSAQLDIFDGSASVEGPLGAGTFFAAVRRSWVDAVLALVLPRAAPDTARELRVAPRYYDYRFQVAQPLLGGTATLSFFGSDDALELVRDEDLDERNPTFRLKTGYHRLAARLQTPLGAAVQNDLTAALGWDQFDVLQTDIGVRTTLRSITLRDALAWRPSRSLRLELGIDALLRGFDYSIYAPPIRAPGSIGGFLGDVATTEQERATGSWVSPAAWVEADWRPLPRLRLVPGLRVDADSRLQGRKVWVDPRLTVFYDARPGTTLVAAAGLYGEPPAPQQTTSTFGNSDVGAQRAVHWSAGVRQALPWSSRGELTFFYKSLHDVVSPTRAAGPDGEPLLVANGGAGEAFGVELLLRRTLTRGLYGWLAYTWSRASRQDDPTLPSFPAWHPFAFDQTHVLTLVLSQRLPRGWTVGTRVRAASGNPYTPFEGSVLDANTGRYQCVPSPRPFSARLPGFFQTDVRVDRTWRFEAWTLAAYVDVQNATNRENAEFNFPSFDCSERVSIPGIPAFPSFGVRGEW
jgi:TonB family protein